jgi:hypothetical protein
MMLSEKTKQIFIKTYTLHGSERFLELLLNRSMESMKSIKNSSQREFAPELELISYYEKFLDLYRKENNEIYLNIAKQFRKAAHKVYRELLKHGETKINERFLNIVK